MFSIIKASDITAWFLGRSGRVMTKATLSSLFYLSNAARCSSGGFRLREELWFLSRRGLLSLKSRSYSSPRNRRSPG